MKSVLSFALLAIALNVSGQTLNPRITGVSSSSVTCNGGNNGSIIITSVSGGFRPYQFSNNGGSTFQSSNRFVNLRAGTYSLMVRDSMGRRSDLVFRQITEPDKVVVTCQSFNLTCNGNNAGAISAIASGGMRPYTYLWSNSSTSANQSGLSAGTYSVVVTDSIGCTASCSAEIKEPARLVATATGTNLNCANNASGTVSVGVTGGTPPYFFKWDKGTDITNQTQTGLTAGTYSVTVTDTNQCMARSSVTLIRQGTASKLSIGDTTSCGIVFYVDPIVDSLNPCKGRYLICAFTDQDPGICWYGGSYITTGSTDDRLFDKRNADQIIRIQGDSALYAANVCAKFQIPGNACTGWYLPSSTELKLIYTNLVENRPDPLGNFANEGYWSSVEKTNRKALIIDFYDGRIIANDKANKYHVRAIKEYITE